MEMRILVWLSVLFGVSELILTFIKRSDSGKVEKRNDKGSFYLLWLAITVGITAAFFFAHRKDWSELNKLVWLLGILIYVLGLIIRWLSILQLRGGFTVDVVVSSGHKLKTDGIYSRVRHPSYLGILLILTGLTVAMNSIFSVILAVVPVFVALAYRINVEEKLLSESFREEYLDYMKRTRRLLPFIY
ncbi:MAG: isoprenylcysteine carboxylmethyltransferase family protein [Bacteroidales bacterium]